MTSFGRNSTDFSTTIITRVASVEDAKMLSMFGAKTFFETFAPHNTEEDMRSYLQKTFDQKQIEREVSDPACTFILAYISSELVGYAKLRTGAEPDKLQELNAIEIERIYSVKEYHGKNVGTTLMETCLELAKERGHNIVWLGVWEHNPRAIAFYKKWGFEVFGSHPFMLGTDLQTDLLMKIKIT